MIKALMLTAILCMSALAQAKNLSGETPSRYFQENPEARAEFIKSIESNENMSAEKKKAYISLVSPDANGEFAGDEALELVDAADLKWFYGEADESDQLVHQIHSATQASSADVARCKARYTLCVHISKGKQRLYATLNGATIASVNNTPVSTARSGKWTPTGIFSVGELAGRWRTSTIYDDAALYYAMQLDGNIFLHATSTNNYRHLGHPASAGCIRTTLEIAGTLNELMKQVRKNEGNRNIQIIVTAN